MQLAHIEQNKLSISSANMRAGKKPPEIGDILPSVRARGILVPLLVRPNGGPDSFEIVAGRRRFFAAKAVAEESGLSEPLPCAIMEAGDDAAALEASLIENVVRLDAHEVEQWETFTRLVTKEGRKPEEIAATFGITEVQVKRALALGNLLPKIRLGYRKGEIDAATVRYLTLATKAQQREWLALFEDPQAYAPTGLQLKASLFGGAPISTDRALFDLATYPGEIVADLFGEGGYFADADAFWEAQRAAI
jgi:ParB family transcriptional regulator, chromosome partitioning protein